MQITDLRGRLYKARRKRVGEHKGNQYTRMECTEKPNIPKAQGRVTEQIAAELGINRDTVMTAANFVDGLDKAEAVVPGFKDAVLTGEVKAQKQEVAAMRKQTPDEIKNNSRLFLFLVFLRVILRLSVLSMTLPVSDSKLI